MSIDGARGVLFNITGGENLGLHEINAAAQVIAEVVDPEAEIIFGTAIDPRLGDEVQITLIATGFARPVAVSPVPEQYRRTGTDDEPVRESSSRRRRASAAAPDPNDIELPTFLRRTVPTR